jgi:hypothetical protein
MAKRTLDELETFCKWQENNLFSMPLSPCPEDAIYALKITCKMVRDYWNWDDKDIEQAIEFFDNLVGHPDYGWDLELLKDAVREDLSLLQIAKELDIRMGIL